GGDDLLAHDLKPLYVVDLGDIADHGLDAHAGQPPQPADQLPNLLAVVSGVKAEHGRLLDLVIVAPDRLAVFAQDIQLARQLRSRKEVAGIGILGDQAQCFLFAHAPDQDPGTGAAQALGDVQRSLEPEVFAVEGLLATPLAFPHLQADLQRLLQSLEPFGDWRERNAKAAAFRLVPGGADTEPRPAAREDVKGRHGFGEHAGV